MSDQSTKSSFGNKYGPGIVLAVIALILFGAWGSEMSSKIREPLTDAERDDLFKKRGIVPVDTNIQLVAYNKEKTDFTPVNLTLLTAGVVFVVWAILAVYSNKWKPEKQVVSVVIMFVILLIVVTLTEVYKPTYPIIAYYPSADDLSILKKKDIKDTASKDFENAGKDLAITPNPEKEKAYYDIQRKIRSLRSERVYFSLVKMFNIF